MNIIELLNPLRQRAGKKLTTGLDDATLLRFAASHPELELAAQEAVAAYRKFSVEFPELLDADEAAQIAALQAGFVNFYAADNVNPYVAIAARGSWVITLKGAVVNDCGGYGMIGLGHAPQEVLDVMAEPSVMANVGLNAAIRAQLAAACLTPACP